MDSLQPRRSSSGWRRPSARVAGAERLLVASDFDGTLAPLVDDPARARALPAAEAALVRLAALPRDRGGAGFGEEPGQPAGRGRVARGPRHPGRGPRHRVGGRRADARRDGRSRRAGAGAGRRDRGRPRGLGRAQAVQRRHPPALRAARASWPTPSAPRWRSCAQAGYHVLEGHGVVEALVRTPAKGAALHALRRSLAADAVVYLGDDVTDDDAFAVLGEDDLAISIGPTPTGAALPGGVAPSRRRGADPAGRGAGPRRADGVGTSSGPRRRPRCRPPGRRPGRRAHGRAHSKG